MKPSMIATVLAILLGVPLIVMLAQGFAEGEHRRASIPLRAMLGDEAYEQFREGETAKLHYLGDDRLAPDFTLKNQHGETWRMSDQRGKTVVMNFWTITCQPCVEEMPSFERLALIAKEREDLVVVAITTDPDWKTVRSVFGPNSELEVLFDPEREVVRGLFGSRLFPETWVIDPRGVVRVRVDGKRDWSSPIALEMIEQI